MASVAFTESGDRAVGDGDGRRAAQIRCQTIPRHVVVALIRAAGGGSVEANVVAAGREAAELVGPVRRGGRVRQVTPCAREDLRLHAGQGAVTGIRDRARDRPAGDEGGVDARGHVPDVTATPVAPVMSVPRPSQATLLSHWSA